MSIKNKRYTKLLNTIIREELQKGNLPTSKEFVAKVNQYILNNNLNGPSLDFRPVRRGATARAEDHNKIMNDTYSDLETLYESVIEQHDKSVVHFNKFDVEKAKLDYQLDELENKLKELTLLYGEEGYLNSVYDVFVDFSHVDTEKTTANIDIAKHEVRISDIKNRSKKIDEPTTTRFEILPSIKPQVELRSVSGSTADAVSGKSNLTWQTLALTKDRMDVGGLFYTEFNTVQLINRISIDLQSIKPTFVKVEITSDNLNWVLLPYYEKGVTISNNYTFDFPSLNVLKVRFTIGKSEPDSETLTDTGNGVMKYSYLFGIKDISFYTFEYALEAELYSNTLDAEPDSKKNFTIDKVSLNVEEELPNGTDIQYFIAVPEEDEAQLEWKRISPVGRENPQYDQIIDFKNITTSIPDTFSINPSISIGEYELENLYANGIKFYKIGEIQGRKIIDGTEKLFIGKNTWSMKSYEYQHIDHATHTPSIDDWIRPENSVKEGFVKITDGKPGLLLNKARSAVATNYMFKVGVFSSKDKELVAAIPTSLDPICIYVNGEIVFQGIPSASSKASYIIQSGWNEIIVLTYNNKSVGTVNGATLDINLDIRKYGSNVYSKAKAMEKVSLFDLRYNVINTDYDKYALQEVNGKTYVVLNNAMPGLEYQFFYNYVDGEVKDELLFKAILTRDDSITETSPKLKSYRLRFS